MKESMSNALIMNIIITFLFIFIILFAGSSSYTKAFKVKNRIISILEKYENELVNKISDKLPSNVQPEIESALADAGYTKTINNGEACRKEINKRFGATEKSYNVIQLGDYTYRYCIAEFVSNTRGMENKYYAVITYMYFEIPLIGRRLEFPVYGETKTMNRNY